MSIAALVRRLARPGLVALLEHLPWLLSGLILLVMVVSVPAFRRPLYWLYLSQQYFAPAMLAPPRRRAA